MRARVAYISSLGTTAILVAAALLMLALVGALVAFRGWPGNANGAAVQPVPLGLGSRIARTVIVRPAATTRHVVRVRSSSARAATKARASTAGLVKSPEPDVVPGIVMEPVPPATMTPVAPGPRGGSAAPVAQPAVAPPATPNPGDPTRVPAPSNPLVGDPLAGTPLPPGVTPLVPNGAPPPQAPSTDQVMTMVGELIGTPPPPAAGTVADSLRR
jgi:hypothetical protein